MTDMYRIMPIEGKGIGVVATKFIKRGTVIIKEKPQMQHVKRPHENRAVKLNDIQVHNDEEEDYIKAVLSSFDQMSELDKKEYLELHSQLGNDKKLLRYFEKELKFLTIISKIEKDFDKAQKMLRIVGIYETNAFDDGVRIKTSRINYSCFPNTFSDDNGFRAIYDIKEGQEITINYSNDCELLSMRTKVYRQKFLFDMWGFTCLCDLCKKQDHVPTKIETEIEELIEEIEKLDVEKKAALRAPTPISFCMQFPPEKCRKQIECYKKLYKLGKERKAHRYCLYSSLGLGFEASKFGYDICKYSNEHQYLAEFKNECVNFAKAALGFGKLLGDEVAETEEWKKRLEDFEK